MKTETPVEINSTTFGTTSFGEAVRLFTLTNDQGMEIRITNYGGIVVSIKVPDRIGQFDDVVLGHDSLEGYLNHSRYFGALIGRHANRIARGRFALDGIEYRLSTNNGANHLHGGMRGFDKVVWTPREIEDGLELRYASPDGEEGYPGNVEAIVTYTLTESNELRIDYRATTDRKTIVSLTNHSYFNLAGGGTILGHELQINADAFTPVAHGLVTTGEILCVQDTPMDFRSPTAIGRHIDDDDEQLQHAGGYDHNFVLRDQSAAMTPAAVLFDPSAGRKLEIFTTEPGMQFYSGNFLDGSIIGKNGRAYVRHSGCCLEAQHFPDSPNHPNFPSTVLQPGEEYRQTTVHRFSVE